MAFHWSHFYLDKKCSVLRMFVTRTCPHCKKQCQDVSPRGEPLSVSDFASTRKRLKAEGLKEAKRLPPHLTIINGIACCDSCRTSVEILTDSQTNVVHCLSCGRVTINHLDHDIHCTSCGHGHTEWWPVTDKSKLIKDLVECLKQLVE